MVGSLQLSVPPLPVPSCTPQVPATCVCRLMVSIGIHTGLAAVTASGGSYSYFLESGFVSGRCRLALRSASAAAALLAAALRSAANLL